MNNGSGGSFASVSMSSVVRAGHRRFGSQPFADLADAKARGRQAAATCSMKCGRRRPISRDQRIDRPHPGQSPIPADRDTAGQRDWYGRRPEISCRDRAPSLRKRADAAAVIGPRSRDLKEARPAHDPGRIQRHVDGIVGRGFFQRVDEIMGGEIVDDVFVPHHGVAEPECAVGKFERDLPAVRLVAAVGRRAALPPAVR